MKNNVSSFLEGINNAVHSQYTQALAIVLDLRSDYMIEKFHKYTGGYSPLAVKECDYRQNIEGEPFLRMIYASDFQHRVYVGKRAKKIYTLYQSIHNNLTKHADIVITD